MAIPAPFADGNFQQRVIVGLATLTAGANMAYNEIRRLTQDFANLDHLLHQFQNRFNAGQADLIARVTQLADQVGQVAHRQEMIQANQGRILIEAVQIREGFPALRNAIRAIGRGNQPPPAGFQTYGEAFRFCKDAGVSFFNPLSVVNTMYNTGSSYLGIPAVAKGTVHAYVAYGAIPKYFTQLAKYCTSFFVELDGSTTDQFCSTPYTAVWCASPLETGGVALAKAAQYGTWALAKGIETTGTAATNEVKRQMSEGFNNFRDDMKEYVGDAVKNATETLFNPSSFFSSKSTETPQSQSTFNFEDGVPLGSSSAGGRSSIPPSGPTTPNSNEGSDLVPVAMLVGAATLTYIIGSQIAKFFSKTTQQSNEEK